MFRPKGVMFFALVFSLLTFSCSGPDSDLPLLTAAMPLHLEEHIDDARIDGSEVSEEVFAPVEWDFSEPQPEWKAVKPIPPQVEAVKPVRVDDALRLPLIEANRFSSSRLAGVIYVDLPDWNIEDWAHVDITARTRDPMLRIGLYLNYTEDKVNPAYPFYSLPDGTPLITDGTVQTYRLSPNRQGVNIRSLEEPWTQLGIWFTSKPGEEAVTLDMLSVKVVPKEHIYADAPAGVRVDKREEAYRRTLYTHTPGRIEYRVRVPQAGRLDFGMGVLREKVPITFRIVASQTREQEVTLFEETYANSREWVQRSVDLSAMTGKTVKIALEADAEQPGSVALWAAPTLTGERATEKPNVIFYVIDGGCADNMSVYGYNRRTTPYLERLAAEGAVFEYVYSNSSWTKPSTRSFMTSLQTSVLGSTSYEFDALPQEARTMAEHFQDAGYQTGVFTSNAWAGSLSSLQRSVDWLRDEGVDQPSVVSSVELHEEFWKWREAYPGAPFWAHFQTTDVHGPFAPVPPFAGMYVPPGRYEKYLDDKNRLKPESWWEQGPGERWLWSSVFDDLGINRVGYYATQRDIYDEALAHQDYQLGRFIERLKASGDWENTIFIVAADHGSRGAMNTDFGLVLQNSLPEQQWAEWGPLFRSSICRVPLIVAWPGHIEGGQRFSEAVSMIDVLPTLLELVGLPKPEVFQGQSLAPLLRGTGSIEFRPVVIEEVEDVNENQPTGKLHGLLEVVDGRWGASLAINGGFAHPDNPDDHRPTPLVLYDLWADPLGLHPINKERPDLVEKYTKFLEEQWAAHRNLSKLFTPSGKIALTPEQLETLRSLGYID